MTAERRAVGDGAGVAEFVLAIQPEMRELLRLREEVVGLRIKTAPPTPMLAELMADLPITVRRNDDGTWSASVNCDGTRTGVAACESDVAAFKAAIRHVATLLGKEWSREDDE